MSSDVVLWSWPATLQIPLLWILPATCTPWLVCWNPGARHGIGKHNGFQFEWNWEPPGNGRLRWGSPLSGRKKQTIYNIYTAYHSISAYHGILQGLTSKLSFPTIPACVSVACGPTVTTRRAASSVCSMLPLLLVGAAIICPLFLRGLSSRTPWRVQKWKLRNYLEAVNCDNAHHLNTSFIGCIISSNISLPMLKVNWWGPNAVTTPRFTLASAAASLTACMTGGVQHAMPCQAAWGPLDLARTPTPARDLSEGPSCWGTRQVWKNDEKGMLSDDFALLQSCKRVFFLLVIDPTSHQTLNFLLAVTRMSHEDTVSEMHNF